MKTKTDDFPAFRPRAPWLGADLQTMRNWLRAQSFVPLRQRIGAEAQVIEVALPHSPGDHIRVSLNAGRAVEGPMRPLLLVIHGLTGCEDSDNILSTASHFLELGYSVARVNLRGAGPGAGLAISMYHAGLTADLGIIVDHLKLHPLAAGGMVAMGVSLGGNLLLKYLGESGADCPLQAAVSVSAPIQLKQAQMRIEEPRNILYHRILLKDMLRGLTGLPRMLEVLPRGGLGRIRRIYDFDNLVVAGYHGYEDADHYYRENSAGSYLGSIRRPTLMIHAKDDPWIPAAGYADLPDNPALTPLMPSTGGHVGFHGRRSRQPWHDRVAVLFFENGAQNGVLI